MEKKGKRQMKKLLVIAAACIMLAMSITAYADKGATSVIIDGKAISFNDAYPYVDKGRTLVPVRAVADAMG